MKGSEVLVSSLETYSGGVERIMITIGYKKPMWSVTDTDYFYVPVLGRSRCLQIPLEFVGGGVGWNDPWALLATRCTRTYPVHSCFHVRGGETTLTVKTEKCKPFYAVGILEPKSRITRN